MLNHSITRPKTIQIGHTFRKQIQLTGLLLAWLWLGLSGNASAQCTFVPSNITVSGFTCSSIQANGIYTPNGTQNGAPRWISPNGQLILWIGSKWSITDPDEGADLAYNTTGSITNLPCTGWTASANTYLGCGAPTILTGGCGSLASGSSLTVSIAASPSLTVASGSSVTLTASGANSFTWSTGQTTQVISVTASGDYSVTGVGSGCSGTATTNVTILPPSLALVTTSSPATVCAGNALTLTASASGVPGPYSYTWTAPAGLSFTSSATASTVTALARSNASGVQTATVTAAGPGGTPVSTTTVTLTVNALPPVTISASTTQVTGSQAATLTVSGASSYTWSTGATGTAISVLPTQTTLYSVTGTSNGCSATATATISTSCVLIPAQATPPTTIGVLGPGNCPINLSLQGVGSMFLFTGPDGYVFSNVYRTPGPHPATAPGIKKPGSYTITVSTTNNCGQISTQVLTFVITGTGCK